MGVPCSLTCNRFFIRIEALQGSLPDIECETDVNIVFLSLENENFELLVSVMLGTPMT